MPGNSLKDCKTQFANTGQEAIGFRFCECIHVEGNSLEDCLGEFEAEK